MVYNNYTATFEDLLAKDNLFLIHHQNMQTLLIEIYKALHELPGATINELFTQKQTPYSLRKQVEVLIPRINTVLLKGQNSI